MKSSFGPFVRGVNNRDPEFALSPDEKGRQFLRDAMNCDITDKGTLKRRNGYARVGDAPATAQRISPAGVVRSHLGYLTGELDGTMAGKHINRHVAVQGNKLLFSYPFAPNLTNGAFHYEQFIAPITGWISTDSGLYVSSDCVYYIPGALPAKETRQVHPVPALAGSFGAFPFSQDIFFVTPQGVMIGTQEGEVRLVHWDAYATELQGSANTVFRERDGMRQIIAVINQTPSLFPGASETFMDAEVF